MSGPAQPPPDLVLTPGTSVETILALAPPWLLDEFSIEYLFTLALQEDGMLDRTRLGVLQRFPGVPQCQPEALAAIASDRQITRGRFEPNASFAERVRRARTTWKLAGDAQTLLRQISAYFNPSPPVIRYVVNGTDENGARYADWTSIDQSGVITTSRAVPNNWDWDGKVGMSPPVDPTTGGNAWNGLVPGAHPAGNIRFWIIIYATITPLIWGWPPATPTGSGLDWGDGITPPDPLGGNSWGFLSGAQWYVDIRQIIDQWKAAGSHTGDLSAGCDGGIIVVGGASPILAFDPSYVPGGPPGYPMPDGTWANPSNRGPFADALPVFLSGL